MKHPKHDKIVKDFEKQKSDHLSKLATKMLKDNDKMQKLKKKKIKKDIFKLF